MACRTSRTSPDMSTCPARQNSDGQGHPLKGVLLSGLSGSKRFFMCFRAEMLLLRVFE